MRVPPARFTVRLLMVVVTIAGWVAFNAYLLSGLEDDLPPGNAGRVRAFRALACAASPLLGGLAAWSAWPESSDLTGSWGRAARRGALAGVLAGGTSWFAATILLCIGHSADGQTPLAAMIVGAGGAALHGVVGALCAVIYCGLDERNEWIMNRSEQSPPSPDPSRCLDPGGSRDINPRSHR